MTKGEGRIVYNILEFKETHTNIITDITVNLFIYISKRESLDHVFYINLKQGKSTIKQVSIQNRNLNESLAITKAILSDIQLRALLKSKKGDLFNEKHQNGIRQKILASNYLEKQLMYASNHYDYSYNQLKEYAIQLMV